MGKRKECISWDGYFIGLAAIASFRSKDPSTQNGACIVQKDSPVALGYNGFPRGCSDDEYPWEREGKNSYETKYPYVEHAERNAIYNASRRGIALEGSTIYIYSERGYYPCDECTRAIIQSGIRKVVMSFVIDENTDKYNWTATKRMLKSAGIEVFIVNINSIDANKLFNDFELISKKFQTMSSKIYENKENKNV